MQFIQQKIKQIYTELSNKFEKQTQHSIQNCKQVINRKLHKHLINTQSKGPQNSMPTKQHKKKTCL